MTPRDFVDCYRIPDSPLDDRIRYVAIPPIRIPTYADAKQTECMTSTVFHPKPVPTPPMNFPGPASGVRFHIARILPFSRSKHVTALDLRGCAAGGDNTHVARGDPRASFRVRQACVPEAGGFWRTYCRRRAFASPGRAAVGHMDVLRVGCAGHRFAVRGRASPRLGRRKRCCSECERATGKASRRFWSARCEKGSGWEWRGRT